MVLNLALNYSGREEIVQAVKKIIKQGIDPNTLDEENFKEYLYTNSQPDPDLIIRTSGEIRLSNYLLYQSAYSELYFTPVLWLISQKRNCVKHLMNTQKDTEGLVAFD